MLRYTFCAQPSICCLVQQTGQGQLQYPIPNHKKCQSAAADATGLALLPSRHDELIAHAQFVQLQASLSKAFADIVYRNHCEMLRALSEQLVC